MLSTAEVGVMFLAEKPHNPMINAGAILVCALLKTLVKPDMTLAEKFDFTMNYFEVIKFINQLFNSSKGLFDSSIQRLQKCNEEC